jgi:hypothetical protein
VLSSTPPRLTNNILKTKKSSLESVRQIIRQKPEKASGVRQPKKVDCKIGMGAKSITIVKAVTADFVFDCRAAEVPSDE